MAQVAVKIDSRALRGLSLTLKQLERVIWRTMALTRKDVNRLYKRYVQLEIDEMGLRRSGAMRKVRIRQQSKRADLSISFRPDFPATAYRTFAGRGRPGASKQGQYAFIINNTPRGVPRHFIQRAQNRLRSSGEVQAAFNKNLRFIINETLQGR